MSKFGYCVAFLCGIIIFNSCSNGVEVKTTQNYPHKEVSDVSSRQGKSYGAYIAGRVAHLRKNFSQAADFYMLALQNDPNNPELVGKVYLLLTSKGRIDEAAKYARISLEQGDKNRFIYMILAVNDIKNKNNERAQKELDELDGQIYQAFIVPFLSAWNQLGMKGDKEKNLKKALEKLETVKKEPGLEPMYLVHAGMIYDFMGKNDKAQLFYEKVVNSQSQDMSLRALELISNFYLRTGQKDKAVALVSRYNNENSLADMLNNIKRNVLNADPKKVKPIIVSPDVGVSEALLNIAYFLQQDPNGTDLAHMIASMSIYENPNYDFAKLFLADILESREMYEDANEVYAEINKGSVAYYTAQLKKAANYVALEDYESAELLLKAMVLDGYDSYALYLDLGDVLRFSNKQGEAIEYYQKALNKVPQGSEQRWVPLYALGISYEQDGQWDEAEKALSQALVLSDNYYMVLNYLGYSWLLQGKNVDKAFGMIVDAYLQAPTDGHITDSMGWAFYQIGMYDKAVEFLEKAAEIESSNAVISDHLGDAYWSVGRKNEAYFQWNHALTSKDDLREINVEEVKEKIANGMRKHVPLKYDKKNISLKIQQLNDKLEN